MNNIIKPFTVSIEGPIGVGKSRLLNYLRASKEMTGAIFLDEALDKWENYKGKNLLELLYRNPKEFAFTFQNYALLSMIERQIKSDNAEVRIMERSPLSSLKIFSGIMQKAGHISEEQKEILQDWHSLLLSNNLVHLDIDAHIYVKAPIFVALDRIGLRNRAGENHITIEHAMELHQAHEDWLLPNTSNSNIEQHKILVVDGAKTGSDIAEEYIKVVNWIKRTKIERDGKWLAEAAN